MTKFPPRPDNWIPFPETLDKPLDVCDCGHPDYLHRTNYDEQYQRTKTQCNHCMCPMFNFQHKSTQREYFKVKYGETNEKQKNGDVA